MVCGSQIASHWFVWGIVGWYLDVRKSSMLFWFGDDWDKLVALLQFFHLLQTKDYFLFLVLACMGCFNEIIEVSLIFV